MRRDARIAYPRARGIQRKRTASITAARVGRPPNLAVPAARSFHVKSAPDSAPTARATGRSRDLAWPQLSCRYHHPFPGDHHELAIDQASICFNSFAAPSNQEARALGRTRPDAVATRVTRAGYCTDMAGWRAVAGHAWHGTDRHPHRPNRRARAPSCVHVGRRAHTCPGPPAVCPLCCPCTART